MYTAYILLALRVSVHCVIAQMWCCSTQCVLKHEKVQFRGIVFVSMIKNQCFEVKWHLGRCKKQSGDFSLDGGCANIFFYWIIFLFCLLWCRGFLNLLKQKKISQNYYQWSSWTILGLLLNLKRFSFERPPQSFFYVIAQRVYKKIELVKTSWKIIIEFWIGLSSLYLCHWLL